MFYGAGKTELCHPRWDKNVEMWKQSKNYLGEVIAEETGDAVKKTLIFWLDELMAEHAMHGIWSHVLDGGCLLDQLDTDWLTYMYNVVWAMSITTVAWLYDACKQTRQRTLRVICVCNAGKHRSVFFSRMLHQVYMLVFQLMRLRGRHALNWIWAAKDRVQREQHPHYGPNAKSSTRQAPTVLHRIKAVFFNSQKGLEHVVSLNLTDQLFKQTAVFYYRSFIDYVVGTRLFLQRARINGVFPVEDWISDLLANNEDVYDLILQYLELRNHWLPYIDLLLKSFPQYCSLCQQKWELYRPLTHIISELETHEDAGIRFYITQEQLAHLGCDRGGSVRMDTEPAGSVSLPTAAGSASAPSLGSQASGSLSLLAAAGPRAPKKARTATATGSVPLPAAAGALKSKRPAWADVSDSEDVPVDKKPKTLGFRTEPSPHDSPSSTSSEPLMEVMVLQCERSNKVVLRNGSEKVTASDDADFLLWADSKKVKLRLQEEEDVSSLINAAELLLLDNDDLQMEMDKLDISINAVNVYPPVDGQYHSALNRIQFYLFLHMWSVLKQDYSFFVSSKFLRLTTLPLQDENNYDIWRSLACYCYLIWLHRTHSPDMWSHALLKLLLPPTEAWDAWWKRQQLSAQEILEISFSECYGLLVENPLEDPEGKKKEAELKILKMGIKQTDLELGPELPPEQSCEQHDVYVDAKECLPTPRIVPVFRCSAGLVEVKWGNGNGLPQEITRDNIIIETHCYLDVSQVPVPARMTLSDLIGTRNWEQSFRDVTMPPPFWANACGSSARAHACGSSARANADTQDVMPSALATQIHLQALGAEIMATIRPDNVMHPHLRCHVEFMLGMFASVHLDRGDSDEVLLHDFLAGCGIQVKVVSLIESRNSWIEASYEKRHNNEGELSVVRPTCHTIWGEKTRPLGFRFVDEFGRTATVGFYLVHDPCPFGDCVDHVEMLGFGTICNHWHGFNPKHGKMCTLAANRALQYGQIGNKGRTTRGARGSGQYFKDFLQKIGMVAPAGSHAVDADERVCLVGLPRWLPAWYGEGHGPEGETLVPFHAHSNQRHFVERERDRCLVLATHVVHLFDDMKKLCVSSDRKTSQENAKD